MSNKELSNKSSFVNSPAAYAGALAAVSAALIRMFSSPQYTENLLTISAALSPIFGVWIFGLLAKMKLSDAQIAMEEKIKRRMDFLDQQIASDSYPQAEIDSFYKQEKEALAYQSDKNAETPMLKIIAQTRGVPFDLLVEKVLEKSSQFSHAMGAIIGQRQKFEDRILATESIEDLDVIENEVKAWQFNLAS